MLSRIVGLTMMGWVLFVTSLLGAGGQAPSSAWITQDTVPHFQFRCGSVVILGTGTVLTARHCTRDDVSSYTLILAQNVRAQADVVCRSSSEADVATLRSDVGGGALVRRDSSDRVGESVIVAGYPGGEFVTMAAVILGTHVNVYISLTNTTIPLMYIISNPSGKRPWGFSGGPVFDAHRRLVGIVCCGDRTWGTLGMIPLERQVIECPF